ncbi:MAG: IS4 family transposase [Leptolyngbyaceae cyanobacterium MO_188.B28]|nr:IS4 family transposase [Leptolyngbyaceae cyanobacterium MO_188.B28]
MTARSVSEQAVVLSVGDTTYLDYGEILAKREGYGPQGNGGNGLLLHSALAVDPKHGQPIGLLWQKLWNRQHQAKPPADETPVQKKQRRAKARQAKRARPFEAKESYRWVEAMTRLEHQVAPSTRVIHVFDREGDIAEVFEKVNQLTHTGVVVRAAHNRSLEQDPHRLWEKLEAQPIRTYHEVELSETKTRKARTAKLAVRFCPVQLRSPARLGANSQLQVYAVYAHEVDCPEGEEPVSWMLLTSEAVTTVEQALMILRWYSYRWRVEEYHKILKSGCQAERYRLAAEGMKSLLGFLSVIAADLLRLTYLQRTQPQTPAEEILDSAQIQILKAKSSRLPKTLTIAWAVEAIARLGGYLEHRRKTPIGIQVLWRGWAKLQDLVEGWQLANQT